MMTRTALSTSVSTARLLVAVIAGVVLCFIVATAFAQHLEGAIAGRANDIVGNAMPSVEMLSAARGDLRRLQREVDRYAVASPAERLMLRDEILTTRRNIDATLTIYLTLPFFPSEPELFAGVKESFAGLDALLPRPGAALDPAALEDLHRSFDNADQALQRSVSFDAAQGQRLGLEIERIRGNSRGAVVLLDAASVVLAVAAAFLALRQLRRVAHAQALEREVNEQRAAELVAQAEALGQFAGRVAHDVLSPLATASLALELVRHASDHDATARRATDRGLTAVQRVQTLVDGLLAFSRAGGRPEPGVATELGPVLADVFEALAEHAGKNHIALNVAPIPAGAVACNPGVLTSLISNLVYNAIRYMGDAPQRRIDVQIVEAGARWRIEVEDTGPGVPADQQQRIFEPYVQFSPGAHGIGLGLATVERLARAHGGATGLVSPTVHGRGSRFWFELPKSVPAPPERVAVPVPATV